MKHIKAFTLIEMLIVLSILALLTAMILLRSDFLVSQKEQYDVKKIASDIRLARNSAIVENRSIGIYLGPKNQSHLYRGLKREKATAYPNIKSITSQEVSESEPTDIVFSQFGAPQMARTLFILGNSGTSYKITVEVATGKVNIK